VLRTTFVQMDGRPLQRIAAEGDFHLVEHDLRSAAGVDADLRRLVEEEATAEFDLERGPLVRGRLVRLAEDEWALLVTMHHVISDGWSMGIFINELSALYAAFCRGQADPLPPLPLQYADYAAWQRRWIAGDVLQAQADYWKAALSDAPELLELPSDRVRPAQQDFAGTFLEFALDEKLTDALRALSKRHGTTVFMTLLAGWGALMARLSGQNDVVIGSPSANRGLPELEGLIGCFVNTLPLRIDVSGSPSVSQLLERVKARTLAAQQNQDIPFEQIVEIARPARSLAHSPLFQVVFAWQNAPGGRLDLPGLSLSPLAAAPHTTSLFDLTLTLQEANGRIAGGLDARGDGGRRNGGRRSTAADE
jgi:hypothetical protein